MLSYYSYKTRTLFCPCDVQRWAAATWFLRVTRGCEEHTTRQRSVVTQHVRDGIYDVTATSGKEPSASARMTVSQFFVKFWSSSWNSELHSFEEVEETIVLAYVSFLDQELIPYRYSSKSSCCSCSCCCGQGSVASNQIGTKFGRIVLQVSAHRLTELISLKTWYVKDGGRARVYRRFLIHSTYS